MKTTKWSDARHRAVKPDDEPDIQRVREAMRAELRLADLRKHRGASQAKIAKRLEVSQSNVSQLERSDDVKLSTLAHYVEALGGHLEISAVFEDETIPIG
ncbi:MAG TPA: XRE family transcriptional regulator [Solirubrobacteraceae bacterium]|jgi:DNA-binding XRE family transcriptional regulator|nr:XRE family transcriptional regulator [Solirubrobacteraceae bacterium]